jgi:SAM-dependent methyltransferase
MPGTGHRRHESFLAAKEEDRRARDYRAFVGPRELYGISGASQFNLLIHLGLSEHDYLLDVGCGALAAGRLLIPYLDPGHYFGLEPEDWLVSEALAGELGADVGRVKQPVFSRDGAFTLSGFGRTFDFLLAHSIFTHASQGQIRRCLREARKVMTPESTFAATFVPGEEDYEGHEWTWLAPYTPTRMRSLAREAGLDCEPIAWPHPSRQQWVLLSLPGSGGARRRAGGPPTWKPRPWEVPEPAG